MHLYALTTGACVLPQTGMGYFLPTILSGMGWKGVLANLMSAFPSLYAFILEVTVGYHMEYRKERLFHILISSFITMLGFILLTASGPLGWNIGVRYFITFIASSGSVAAPGLLAWRSSMIIGATANAFSVAYIGSIFNIGGGIAPFLYPTSTGPLYIMGGIISSALWAAGIVGTLIIYFYDKHRRKQGYYEAMEMEAKLELEKLNAIYLAHIVKDND
ncbi:hypothetical protein M427DRAFT_45002 [Gonapodya prolifera JEL478]|uniref:MFS general substrate transporter n=1 Tax=Gonapodya prolifera (strain JEL478) TaxID=1344416 RepID=A0A139ACR9_GONPJ|nr:hypothetical protein M427DRAFT_45002 [Gonapodya prolifera JEL478]|eukprot:KXS14616.1 hypothetical protein M427DRAFT_45002 [Gonapodya prolifera JEL478]